MTQLLMPTTQLFYVFLEHMFLFVDFVYNAGCATLSQSEHKPGKQLVLKIVLPQVINRCKKQCFVNVLAIVVIGLQIT